MLVRQQLNEIASHSISWLAIRLSYAEVGPSQLKLVFGIMFSAYVSVLERRTYTIPQTTLKLFKTERVGFSSTTHPNPMIYNVIHQRNVFRSASSSRNSSCEKKKKLDKKVSNSNKLACSCFYLHHSARLCTKSRSCISLCLTFSHFRSKTGWLLAPSSLTPVPMSS